MAKIILPLPIWIYPLELPLGPIVLSGSGFVTGLWMIETIGRRPYLIHLTWSGLKS